jgi:hypothetical protein
MNCAGSNDRSTNSFVLLNIYDAVMLLAPLLSIILLCGDNETPPIAQLFDSLNQLLIRPQKQVSLSVNMTSVKGGLAAQPDIYSIIKDKISVINEPLQFKWQNPAKHLGATCIKRWDYNNRALESPISHCRKKLHQRGSQQAVVVTMVN